MLILGFTLIPPAYAQATSMEIERRVRDLEVRWDSFNALTDLQLNVFLIFVGSLIGLVAIASLAGIYGEIRKRAREESERVVQKEMEVFRKSLEDSEQRTLGELETAKEDIYWQFKAREAATYRIHGQLNDQAKEPEVSYIWWLRAAQKFSEIGDSALVKISLARTYDALNKVPQRDSLSYDDEKEVTELLAGISEEEYATEKKKIADLIGGTKST